jgi:hypothetical protein
MLQCARASGLRHIPIARSRSDLVSSVKIDSAGSLGDQYRPFVGAP